MHASEVLANQVTYLTYLLSARPQKVDSEQLRPTYLNLQYVQDDELSESALALIRRARPLLTRWLERKTPIHRRAVELLKTLLVQAASYGKPAIAW